MTKKKSTQHARTGPFKEIAECAVGSTRKKCQVSTLTHDYFREFESQQQYLTVLL